jgi:hypothetical protein
LAPVYSNWFVAVKIHKRPTTEEGRKKEEMTGKVDKPRVVLIVFLLDMLPYPYSSRDIGS